MSESSSSVWKFLKKANDDGSICQICMCTLKNKGGNTSNLAMHLQRNHPMQYAAINPMQKTNPQALKELVKQRDSLLRHNQQSTVAPLHH